MADEDTLILKDILANLQIPGEGSVSQLILEVRNAIKGISEPTLRDTMVDLKNTMQHEFTVLRQVLRDEAGMGRGTIARPPHDDGGGGGDGEASALKQRMQHLEEHLDEVLSKLERATIALESSGGHGGQGGGDRVLRSFFERETYLSITDAVKKIEGGADKFKVFGDLVQQQTTAGFRDFNAAILQTSLHTLNVASQLRNLHNVLRQEIQSVSTSGVYGSNSLSSMEYFLEGPKRLIDGVLTETDSFRTVLKVAHQAIQEHMVSPMIVTGKDFVGLAHDFQQARQNMREAPGGFDNRGRMTFEETNKSLLDMVEFQHRMGIKSGINDTITEQNTSQSLNFLKIIATKTGETVANLEKSLNEQLKEQQILAGLGRLKPDEAKINADLLNALKGQFHADIQPVLDLSKRLSYFGRDSNQILTNPETPNDIKSSFSNPLSSQYMQQMMQFNELMRRPLAKGETLETREDQIKQLAPAMIQALKQFNEMGFRHGGAAYQNTLGGLKEPLAGSWSAWNSVMTRGAESEALKQRRETDPLFRIKDLFQEYFKSFIQPFLGLPSLIGANTLALGFNLWALKSNTTALWAAAAAFRIGGGIPSPPGGGGGGGLWGAAGKALRWGGGLLGGLGTAYEGYHVYDNARQGNTGQAITTGLGMGAGAAIGGLIGGGSTLGVGTIPGALVGASIGGGIADWLSSWFASNKPEEKPDKEQAPPIRLSSVPTMATPPAILSDQMTSRIAALEGQIAGILGASPTPRLSSVPTIATPPAILSDQTTDRTAGLEAQIASLMLRASPTPQLAQAAPAILSDQTTDRTTGLEGQIANLMSLLRASPQLAQAAPAVPIPTNIAGPAAADVAASTKTSYQDSSLALLTQLVEAAGSGNQTLGQIYGELSRQTGYLGGSGSSAASRYTAQGLTSGSSPAVAAERRTSDASFPWVGGF